MKVTLAGLTLLSSIGESARDGVDYTSDLLGRLLFLWRLSTASWLVVSMSSLIFHFVSSSVCVMIPMVLLLVSLLLGSRLAP